MTWKERALLWLTVIAGICTVIGGLDLTQILPLLPDHVAAWLVMALPSVVTIQKATVAIGDLLDDGIKNDSFKVGLLIGGLILGCQLLTGCAGTPVAVRITDPESGIYGGYSSKSGLSIGIVRPVK